MLGEKFLRLLEQIRQKLNGNKKFFITILQTWSHVHFSFFFFITIENEICCSCTRSKFSSAIIFAPHYVCNKLLYFLSVDNQLLQKPIRKLEKKQNLNVSVITSLQYGQDVSTSCYILDNSITYSDSKHKKYLVLQRELYTDATGFDLHM